MVSRQMRKRMALERLNTLKRFQRHQRRNLLATAGCHKFIIVLDNLKPTFNIGKIFRSAEAFGAREIHLIGTDFFDPAPAVGAFKWVPARFHATFHACYQELTAQEYRLHTLEPDADTPLTTAVLPRKSAFVFGHEEFGISFNKEDFPGIRSLRIPQFGRSQSLNVSIAASIVMYDYVRRHAATQPPAPMP